MTPQEIQQLVREAVAPYEEKITMLETRFNNLTISSLFELAIDRTIQAIGYIKATRKIDTVTPLAGPVTLFVANSSGGAVTHSFTVKDGLIIAVT